MRLDPTGTSTKTPLPLDGIVVVELGQNVAAPFAGLILAHLGARVIKIERPDGGDPTRQWGPPFTPEGSVAFEAFNHNKQSVTLDLKDSCDNAELRRLIVDQADVVLQNLRPGSADRLGLGVAALRSAKPSLIYCSMSAFGAGGPLAPKPGYDPLMQAYAGLMSVTGHEGAPPVRAGVSLVDQGAGLWGVLGILAALLKRRETGHGCTVDTSLYEVALSWMSLPIASFLASGESPRRHGSGMSLVAPYEAVQTRDGHLMIAAGNDRLFERLALALQLPELARDQSFRTNRDRVIHRDRLLAAIAGRAGNFTTSELASILDEAGVPNAAVRDVREVVADPQTHALGMIAKGSAGIACVGLPLRLDGRRPNPPRETLASHRKAPR